MDKEQETTSLHQLQPKDVNVGEVSGYCAAHDVPILLKIQQPAVDETMETTTSQEPASDQPSDVEQNALDTSSEAEQDDIQFSQTRPSVINLGSTSTVAPRPVSYTPSTPTPTLPSPLYPHNNGERPQRMRDWLVRMIDSGRFVGLEWLDVEKMIFRVPWVHAKKRDYNQERDAALFKEWAIHSGKYGDGSDVTTWKINFRCALNGLKDIIERKDLEANDCRVYQMLPSTSPGRRRKRRRPIIHYSDMMQLQTPPSDYLPLRDVRPKLELPLVSTPAITPTTPAGLATTPIQLVPIVSGTPTIPFPIPVATIQASPTTPHQPLSLSPSPTVNAPTLFSKLPQVHTYQPPALITNSNTSDTIRLRPIGSISGGSDRSGTPNSEKAQEAQRLQFSPRTNTSPFSPKLSQDSKTPSLIMYPPLRTGSIRWPPAKFVDNPDALTIRVMYGSITVHMETLDCSKGCRVFYGPLHCRDMLPREEEEMLFGPLESHQISISPRHPSPLATEIFRTLKRGLIISTENNDIYATALCRAVVYNGSSPMKHDRTLEKEERVKVFQYADQFLPDLRQNMETKTTSIPKPYTIFSLSQHWGNTRPLSKNLITIVVTHCKALNDLRVRNLPIYDELLFEPCENQDIRIISPTRKDLEAEEFLNPSSPSPN